MTQFSLAVLVCVVLATKQSWAQVWNYDDNSPEGPSHWAEYYPICGQTSQSPVDITSGSLKWNPFLRDFTYTGYNTPPATASIVNNGHTLQFDVPDNTITINGGSLINKFTLRQFHFHWASSNGVGSEHSIGGVSTPLEVHLVHWNSDKYSNFSQAASQSDGIAVVGILVKVGDPSVNTLNQDLGRLTDDFSKVLHEGDTTPTTAFAVQNLLPSNRTYARYSGSLTTPPCYQSVTWTLFYNSIYVSQSQMDQFRTLLTEGDVVLERNNRPVQPLNGRTVYYSSNL